MRPEETCPTCGTRLGPLHEREMLRHCDACQRPNPRGFRYCGFCAAPLESAAEHAERVDVAAPPGGWPSLARELVELRFFLDRGELDEAYELLSILRERHPGHPALADFHREPAGRSPRPDTQVYQVVDAVLADSASLSATSLPRRSVPQWNAPVTEDGEEGKKTRSHATVSLGSDDEEPTSRRSRVAEPKKSAPARARTDKHMGAVPVAKGEASKRSKRGAASGAVPKAARPGLTVAVPTLQPPKPFASTRPAVDDDEDARPTAIMSADKGLRSARTHKKAAAVDEGGPHAEAPKKASGAEKGHEQADARPAKKADKGSVRKRIIEPNVTIEPRKRTVEHAATPTPPEPEAGKKGERARGARFGQGVLGRLGGKGKP